ncbi:hypothetical protein EDB81DRAFT_769320 [Dactylonectria macrodidyma]|uniref:Uncharacterized protein n=1 Tax=Dactylonectria macrodidyma TaxID=307937 RepID=A0A9P9CXN2_9HYPO|nr:hypothetical protein EDB81DRAFT_769320 [Dactylonectria macrodidyma]
MSLTHFVSTALTTAFVLNAVANLSTSIKVILRYRNTQRSRRGTGSVSVIHTSLSTRYPRAFTAVVITHCLIATSSALAFAVLIQERGDPWSTYLSSSIIVPSMTREMVLEWMLIASCTSRQFTKIKTVMLIETLAMIASAMALRTESATSRHLILSNVFGAQDFLVCLIPVIEKLWTKSFRRGPTFALLPRLLRTPRPRASSPGGSSQIQLRDITVTSRDG